MLYFFFIKCRISLFDGKLCDAQYYWPQKVNGCDRKQVYDFILGQALDFKENVMDLEKTENHEK